MQDPCAMKNVNKVKLASSKEKIDLCNVNNVIFIEKALYDKILGKERMVFYSIVYFYSINIQWCHFMYNSY